MKKWYALIGAALLLLALASVAYAHAVIDTCTPVPGSTITSAPDKLVCIMTEEVAPRVSMLQVFDASNNEVDKGDSVLDTNDPDRKTLVVSLDTSKMPAGVYTVKWAAVTPDDNGHTDGSFQFTIGAAVATAVPTPSGTIEITSPQDDASVPAGDVMVQVKVDGITLGQNGAHWHLYLDDKMISMVTGGATSATVNLAPGDHTLKATIADDTHGEGTSAVISVTATGSGGSVAAATAMPEMTEAAPTGSATAMPEMTEAATTAAATAMPEMTETPAPVAAAAPTPAPTLPQTGGDMTGGLGIPLMLAGLGLLFAGLWFRAARTQKN